MSGDTYIENYVPEWPRYPLSYHNHAVNSANPTLTPAELPLHPPGNGSLPSQERSYQRPSSVQQLKSVNINHNSPDTRYFHSAFEFGSSTTQRWQTPGSLHSTELESSSTDVGAEAAKVVGALTPSDGKEPSPGAILSSSSMDLESRFELILDIIEEAGFDSIDSMATEYYASNFKRNTTPQWAQSLSKTRNLKKFLAALHTSTKDWSSEEARGYREEIVRSAESTYVEELQQLKQSTMRDGTNHMQRTSSESILRARIGEQFEQLFQVAEYSRLLKQDKQLLQQRVSLPLFNTK